MAATTYQILYRATNFNTGITITNNPSVHVEHLAELYHDKHKISNGNVKEKKEATDKKSNDIINGNDANNVKYAQLYQYSGTKRINKWDWIPEQEGYVIRDYSGIRDKITNTNFGDEHGDYSGDYLLFEGDTPENGIVVAKTNPMIKENPGNPTGAFEIQNNDLAENGIFYKDAEEVKQILVNSTIAQIDWETHPWITSLNGLINGGANGNSKYFTLETQKSGNGDTINYHNLSVYIGAVFTPSIYYYSLGYNPSKIYDYLPRATVEAGIPSGRFPCTKVTLQPNYIKTYKIPGHWEESSEAPYAVHDVYEKVAQEPWFSYSTEHSLEKALEVARALVEKIGLENVKLVKVVPTDQFLKLK
jgi:hypothetical protein